MNNNEIKRAQFLLKGLGFVPGREDGYYNESTKSRHGVSGSKQAEANRDH